MTKLFVSWLGGAAFVGSLAYAGYVFVVRWGSPPGSWRGWRPLVVDALLFALFAAHHSAFARERAKAWLTRLVPADLERVVYVWIASLLFAGMLLSWQPVGGELYFVRGWPRVVLTAVQAAGLMLIARSVRAISALELAGIRPERTIERLQVGGPYRLVRHPLYLGWLLVVFATARMTGDRLLFAAITTLYLLVAVRWEERSLERAFGEEYARYRERVRWRMLPYVY
jgi:protein-S-isoprenylcysteine O-methyltransferase Ste14